MKQYRRDAVIFGINDIVKILDSLLDLPGPRYSPTTHRSNNYKIVDAVFQAMAEALQRGEKIHIQGLGMFYVKSYKPSYRCPYYYRDKNVSHGVARSVPARKAVVFKPYKYIVRSLNEKETKAPKRPGKILFTKKETKNESSSLSV